MGGVQLADASEARLCRLIQERIGIRILDHQRQNLLRTVSAACELFNLPDGERYCDALASSQADSQLQEQLIAGITVGESYFFRDRWQMQLLRQTLLPNLIASRRLSGHYSLRIWSAGCSDGQELYSIAMLLDNLLPPHEKWNLHLLGTDINVPALARALRGEYRRWSFRATAGEDLERYFEEIPQSEGEIIWSVSAALRKQVRFSYLNIFTDSFPSILSETSAMDLILCRNVFIYFDAPTIAVVMRKFHAALNVGGSLLLGPSDLIERSATEGFIYRGDENSHYYERGDATHLPPLVVAPRSYQSQSVASDLPVAAPAPVSDAERAVRLPAALRPYSKIIRLFGDEAWGDALNEAERLLRQGDNSVFVWQFLAKALANMGRARDALKACDESLKLDPDKHVYFIQALILLELKRLQAAEDALRRTIFIDRYFVEAHYHLGLLLIRSGREEAGIKSLKNALDIAVTASPQRRLHDAGQMDYGRLVQIIRNELRMYQSFQQQRKLKNMDFLSDDWSSTGHG
ncbi:MAG: tetratricopeptide repeat protein [Gammaproteobacteria bacterium]|nr:tetratricopeptide repeat protein [Gammaproteobacteria bacterium]